MLFTTLLKTIKRPLLKNSQIALIDGSTVILETEDYNDITGGENASET